MSTNNLDATTREMWDRTVKDQVYLRHVLLFMLLERNQVLKAGISIKHTLDFNELDTLAQEYAPNDPLTGGSEIVVKTAEWYPKYMQLPIKVTGDEWRRNAGGGDGQIVSLPEYLVKKAHRGLRIKLNEIVYRAGAVARDAEPAAGAAAGMQGLNDALTHDIQYGGLARLIGTPTNTFWQGGSTGNIFTDQADQLNPTVANFRMCIDTISMHIEKKSDVIAIASNTQYRRLQAQVEGQRHYSDKGPHAKYGFTSFEIDEVEVFAEPWLTTLLNADRATHVNYFYMLHLPDWKYYVDAERGLGNTIGFMHQAKMLGGKDEFLDRIMLRANFVCTQPNASIFKSNFTM